MTKAIITIAALLLASCNGQMKESSESAIANQAESLERAANATTDQMIGEIENTARSEETTVGDPAVQSPSNASQP